MPTPAVRLRSARRGHHRRRAMRSYRPRYVV